MVIGEIKKSDKEAAKLMIRRKIVVVGDGACGKTSLINVYSRKDFPLSYMPTVFESNFITTNYVIGKKRYTAELALWDTAGQEDYDRLRPLSYPDTDVVLVCFSIDEPNSLDNVLERWHPELLHFLPSVPRLLVGLKADLRDKVEHTPASLVPQGEAEAVAVKIGASGGYLECSALTKENVDYVFEKALGLTINIKENKRFSFFTKLRNFACLRHKNS
jgi:Ras homolog gene family, member A